MFMKYIKLTDASEATCGGSDLRVFAECVTALHFHFTGKFTRWIIPCTILPLCRIARDFRVILKLSLHERLELKMSLGFCYFFGLPRYKKKFTL